MQFVGEQLVSEICQVNAIPPQESLIVLPAKICVHIDNGHIVGFSYLSHCLVFFAESSPSILCWIGLKDQNRLYPCLNTDLDHVLQV